MAHTHNHEYSHEYSHEHPHEDSPAQNGAVSHGHSHTHTHSHSQTKNVLNRLSRAIGHLTSVRTMVEDGRDCSEVLIQISAVKAALTSCSEVILKDHLEHCISDAIESGDKTAITELFRAVEMMLK